MPQKLQCNQLPIGNIQVNQTKSTPSLTFYNQLSFNSIIRTDTANNTEVSVKKVQLIFGVATTVFQIITKLILAFFHHLLVLPHFFELLVLLVLKNKRITTL